MATRIVRRLYLYVAAFIGLQMVGVGVSGLLSFFGERLLGGDTLGAAEFSVLYLSSMLALVVVGLPLWGAHWALAQRDARSPDGQRSGIRRLYAYGVFLVAALSGLFGLYEALSVGLAGLAGAATALAMVRPLISAAVSGAIWLAHWRAFAADRELVEAEWPNAALRRAYMLISLWFGLGMASFGAGVLIHTLLQRFAFGAATRPSQLAVPTAALISGALLWLLHETWARRLVRRPGPLQADELASTLRQVYLALVITVALIAALTGLTALIAAGLRAAIGAAAWAAAFGEETRAMAAVLVALPLLLYERGELDELARLSRAPGRVDTARRLIGYLMAAVSLVALYFGLGGLAGTLLRRWLGVDPIGATWATPLSWYTAMAIVALPVYWAASWRSEGLARASAEEERVLSRRIYLYAGLLFGVVAAVITVTQLIRLVVVAAMGEADPGVAGEIGRLVGYSALGVVIATGYALLLRRAGAARGTLGAGWRVVLVAGEPLRNALLAAVAHELPGAALVAFEERDTAERRAALAEADALVLSLSALGDPSLAGFAGRRLLLATPVPGAMLVGARYDGPGLAREAARTLRGICGAPPPEHRPAAPPALAPGSA